MIAFRQLATKSRRDARGRLKTAAILAAVVGLLGAGFMPGCTTDSDKWRRIREIPEGDVDVSGAAVEHLRDRSAVVLRVFGQREEDLLVLDFVVAAQPNRHDDVERLNNAVFELGVGSPLELLTESGEAVRTPVFQTDGVPRFSTVTFEPFPFRYRHGNGCDVAILRSASRVEASAFLQRPTLRVQRSRSRPRLDLPMKPGEFVAVTWLE